MGLELRGCKIIPYVPNFIKFFNKDNKSKIKKKLKSTFVQKYDFVKPMAKVPIH